MKRLTILLFVLLASSVCMHAQDLGAWTMEKKPLLFEKLYLHVDRELYAPGDMIWMKAYQVNGVTHELNANYRNLFIQLINDSGRVVKDELLFSINGQAQGNFTTDSLPGGRYTIRAYTKYLQNFGEQSLFHKKIVIREAQQSNISSKRDSIDFSTMEVAFLPEGGNMVLNTTNTVAFKAIDNKGRGIPVSGKIVDDLGKEIVSFMSVYRGMGKFNLLPVDNRSYYALIDQNPKMKIKLDHMLENGINLSCKDGDQSMCFTLSINTNLEEIYPIYLVVSHKGTTFTRLVEMEDYTQTICLDKALFPEGISKVTVLDTLKKPVAERLVYVEKEESAQMDIQPSKKQYGPREKVSLDVSAMLSEGDSITSTLSMNVVNNAYFGAGGNSQNIKSYLFIDSELKGAIEAPAAYFTDDKIPSSEKLDLLMMVNGWRSYLWDEIPVTSNVDTSDWNDAGIEIKGYVKKLLKKAPSPNADVILATKGGTFILEKTKSNELGRFSFPKVFLGEVSKITLNAITENGSRNAEIILDEELRTDTVIRVGSMKNTCFDSGLNSEYDGINSYRKAKMRAFELEKGSILMKDIDILQKRSLNDDGHYRIYSNPDKSLTISVEDRQQYQNVLDYLEGKITGLTIIGDDVTIRGGKQPLFVIDGIPLDKKDFSKINIEKVKAINMSDVDKVEVLKSGANLAAFGSQGADGVIAIYRKMREEIPYSDTHVNGRLETTINGFHKAPKFYSPSYSLENINDPKPDYRPTLLWEPELTCKDGKAQIEFYTSDELARYVVFVEGITKNGKICYGTTNFVVDKK